MPNLIRDVSMLSHSWEILNRSPFMQSIRDLVQFFVSIALVFAKLERCVLDCIPSNTWLDNNMNSTFDWRKFSDKHATMAWFCLKQFKAIEMEHRTNRSPRHTVIGNVLESSNKNWTPIITLVSQIRLNICKIKSGDKDAFNSIQQHFSEIDHASWYLVWCLYTLDACQPMFATRLPSSPIDDYWFRKVIDYFEI